MYKLVTIITTFLSMVLTPIVTAQGSPRNGNDAVPAEVERAYKKGLKFLASTQKTDGSWPDSQGRQPGVVGLAILAFLAHGEDPQNGPYAKNIQKAVDFLIKSQKKENGYIGNSMYNHGFATLALAECYGMMDDKRIAPALKSAVKLILSAQKRNPKKAWRYGPDDRTADTTVAGCQIVALLGARNAGVPVPDQALDDALKYMASCRGSNGSYGYTSKSGGRLTLTAIGSLCLSLAKKKDDPAFPTITKYLKRQMSGQGHHYRFYHEYYMSQALFHADHEAWKKWNAQNIKLMTASQQIDGKWSDGTMGITGATSGALLSMALNYRFLPIYEK